MVEKLSKLLEKETSFGEDNVFRYLELKKEVLPFVKTLGE